MKKMGTLVCGSTTVNLFDSCLESGTDFMDMTSFDIYRFGDYAKSKINKWPISGVYKTDSNGIIVDLWEEEEVTKYIKDHNLHPKWMK